MEREPGYENPFAEEHGDTIEQLLGQIKGKLLVGAYDVMNNHHEDILELTAGHHRYEHRLTRDEAQNLERAIWSAGEDQSFDHLLKNIHHGLEQAGFSLEGNDLDITVRLREAPIDS